MKYNLRKVVLKLEIDDTIERLYCYVLRSSISAKRSPMFEFAIIFLKNLIISCIASDPKSDAWINLTRNSILTWKLPSRHIRRAWLRGPSARPFLEPNLFTVYYLLLSNYNNMFQALNNFNSFNTFHLIL